MAQRIKYEKYDENTGEVLSYGDKKIKKKVKYSGAYGTIYFDKAAELFKDIRPLAKTLLLLICTQASHDSLDVKIHHRELADSVGIDPRNLSPFIKELVAAQAILPTKKSGTLYYYRINPSIIRHYKTAKFEQADFEWKILVSKNLIVSSD